MVYKVLYNNNKYGEGAGKDSAIESRAEMESDQRQKNEAPLWISP
jgi:hypothetical protein